MELEQILAARGREEYSSYYNTSSKNWEDTATTIAVDDYDVDGFHEKRHTYDMYTALNRINASLCATDFLRISGKSSFIAIDEIIL